LEGCGSEYEGRREKGNGGRGERIMEGRGFSEV